MHTSHDRMGGCSLTSKRQQQSPRGQGTLRRSPKVFAAAHMYRTDHQLTNTLEFTIFSGRSSSTLVPYNLLPLDIQPRLRLGFVPIRVRYIDCGHVNGVLIGAQMGRKRQRIWMAQTGEASAADWTSSRLLAGEERGGGARHQITHPPMGTR